MIGSFLFCITTIVVLVLIRADAGVLPLTSNNTIFLLYTQSNRDKPVAVIPYDDSTLGNFNASNDVKYITHGFHGDAKEPWIIDTKDALLNMRDMNIFAVDWAPLAKDPYESAARNATMVGQYIGTLIQYLITKGSTFEKQHLIGWSLGGHVVGFAGASVNGQVARISSLDPAYFGFEDSDPSTRTDSTDAVFVDVIHTYTYQDTGIPDTTEGIAHEAPLGHVDFYPNGGHKQKGCDSNKDPGGCNHARAPWFFLESVRNPKAFVGYKCDNYSQYESGLCYYECTNGCSQLGYNAKPSSESVKFYLATRDNSPYSGKQLYVVLKFSEDQVNTSGNIFLTLKSVAGNDRAQILDDTEQITPGSSINVAIAVFDYLLNFNGASVEFTQGRDSSLSILSIDVRDPETNQRICSDPVFVKDGTSEDLHMSNC